MSLGLLTLPTSNGKLIPEGGAETVKIFPYNMYQTLKLTVQTLRRG